MVLAVTEGGAGVRRWRAAMVRWPRGRRLQLAAVAPLGFLVLGLGVVALTGDVPPAKEFIRFSGAATQRRASARLPWRSSSTCSARRRAGAGTHCRGSSPDSARCGRRWFSRRSGRAGTRRCSSSSSSGYFSPLVLPGFFIGLTAGALVLTSLYNGTGGSILAVAVLHASYNLAAATTAPDGIIAAVATTCVIVWAVSLVQREPDGQPALGRPRMLA